MSYVNLKLTGQKFMKAKMGKTAIHPHQNADVNCHISWTDWATIKGQSGGYLTDFR